MILRESILQFLADRIRDLQDRNHYTRDELCTPEFLLETDGNLRMYYAPFDTINPGARVAIVGITPGWTQMEIGIRVVHQGLRAGMHREDAYRKAKEQASFAGAMREHLVNMLDRLGLAALLQIDSSDDLFGPRQALLHTTSTFRYPVFNADNNYTGSLPPPRRPAMLMQMARDALGPELAQIPGAVIVPLGRSVDDVLQMLEAEGRIMPGRRLVGFPHPSGANGHRAQHFAQRESELRDTLESVLG